MSLARAALVLLILSSATSSLADEIVTTDGGIMGPTAAMPEEIGSYGHFSPLIYFAPEPQTCYSPRFGCYPGNSRHIHRYPAFHGYYYRRPYNYRNVFDYPWHAGLHEPTSMFSFETVEEVPGENYPADMDQLPMERLPEVPQPPVGDSTSLRYRTGPIPRTPLATRHATTARRPASSSASRATSSRRLHTHHQAQSPAAFRPRTAAKPKTVTPAATTKTNPPAAHAPTVTQATALVPATPSNTATPSDSTTTSPATAPSNSPASATPAAPVQTTDNTSAEPTATPAAPTAPCATPIGLSTTSG